MEQKAAKDPRSFWIERGRELQQYIMALDAGTTSSRCIIFDKEAKICMTAQKEFSQHYPKTGWVEHDADLIWSTQLGVAVEAMARLGVGAESIAAIGITNQRETTVLWDKNTGEPVYPAIVWQCRRTSAYCDELKSGEWGEKIRKKTGLIPDAYFSASKIKWILDHVEGVRERAERGEILFGTIDCFLIWKLSKGRLHITDYSNASRTMLFNIHRLCWDEELLSLFDIPRGILPKVRNSSEIYGYTDSEFFGRPIAIASAIGDQQAALFGQNCFSEGEVKSTYGTGCFLLMNTGEKPVDSHKGLLTTIAWGRGDTVCYALEGSVFVAGAVIQWLRDEMRLIDSAEDSEYMARKVNGTNGCYVVPAFTGMGAPNWDQYARGTILGITRGVNKYHIIRAALESIAYQVGDVLEVMEEESGIRLSALKADGGASVNDFLMQTQSDLCNISVERPVCIESTALGAAYLAGLAAGYWKDVSEIRARHETAMRFLPMLEEEKRRRKIRRWKKAVQYAFGWAKDEEEE